jgi:hypothetical protein
LTFVRFNRLQTQRSIDGLNYHIKNKQNVCFGGIFIV